MRSLKIFAVGFKDMQGMFVYITSKLSYMIDFSSLTLPLSVKKSYYTEKLIPLFMVNMMVQI